MMDMFGQTELTEQDPNSKKRQPLLCFFIDNRLPMSYDTKQKIN